MKILGKVAVLIAVITIVAVATTKKSKKHELSEDESNSDNLNKDDNLSKASSSEKSDNESNSVNTNNNRNSDYVNAKTQKMYKDLGMTKAQKRRYEADYKTVMDEWGKKNPGKTINEKEKVAQHNATLNAVLNEAQYSIYREWAKDNA